MTTHVLHFTLGPVQGFVAEARRTRDLWAGSFLLSWLSAHAMRAVEDACGAGSILFPEVASDPLMRALRTKGTEGGAPYIGSVPNRFKACVPATFKPEVCKAAVNGAWSRLAARIWDRFVKDAAATGDGTEEIWQRQVKQFWDMAWVMAPDPGDRSDGAWLDQRKNWRTHFPVEPEGGDHCQLMGFYQEVSGYVRAASPDARDKQDKFWKAMQRKTGSLNLRDGEKLCATALIKRLFPVLGADDLRGTMGGWVPGAPADSKSPRFNVENWPSVSYVAAAPWLKAARGLDPGLTATANFQGLVSALMDSKKIYGETETRLLGADYTDRFFKLDGHFFHTDAINAMKDEEFVGGTSGERQAYRKKVAGELGSLQDSLKKAHDNRWRAGRSNASVPPSPPFAASEFYAVLIGDGDEIGKNLRGAGGEQLAKQGLADFTNAVPDIVTAHTGVTIYAGGDDVLALLPLDEAIPAAIKLRAAYAGAFKRAQSPWTFSAAIVYAQYHIPLRHVLEQARHQLDAIAKDANGRDSLAVAVLKPGGVAFEWVTTWCTNEDLTSLPDQIQTQAKSLQDKRELTTGFLYNLRERYQPLFEGSPGEKLIADREQMRRFLLAEYRHSGGKAPDAEAAIDQLMRLGFPWRRDGGVMTQHAAFNFEAGLMMRFMAEQGRWFMGARGPGGQP
jgi:CRISPR-associated protein Cmr2